MSHQTSRRLNTFPSHTIVFTPYTMSITKSQAMMDIVATLRERQWAGRGMRTRIKERKNAMGKNG